MCTCFTRIIIIFHFLKQAIGVQQMPPNQIIIGLALFLTFFIMAPTFDKIYNESYVPYSEGKLSQDNAFSQTGNELKKFMLRQTGEKELTLFLELNKGKRPNSALDIPLLVVIPAFVLSEVRIAFQVGFILYLPFIIIDMVIASILMSMGMMMLPPMMISLPFKILLFILVDGWYLLIESIVKGYR
jgi:flagellar biosynthetic protein FliP